MASSTSNKFNPLKQDLIILEPDGRTPASIPFAIIQDFWLTTLYGAIGQGSQIGAAAMLLICLFVTTKREKRRSLVFILNALALVLAAFRSFFACLVYTGPFYNWYRWEMDYWVDIQQAQTISICGAITTYILALILQLSLIFQVHIVCCTLEPWQRHLINVLNGFIAFLVLSVRLGLVVLTIKWNILELEHQTAWQLNRLEKLASATSILFAVGIGIPAMIFSSKLAFAIRRRHSMGMTKFGPMQIIFIMGCQTMLLPFIFTIIVCFSDINTQVQSFAPTIVALCLPLSAIWATANASNVHIANAGPEKQGSTSVGAANSAAGKSYGGSSTDTYDTFLSSDSTTPTKEIRFCRTSEPDLEMQKLDEDVNKLGCSRTGVVGEK